jgi:hypothetical protein
LTNRLTKNANAAKVAKKSSAGNERQ